MRSQTPTPAPTSTPTPTPLNARQERFCQAFVVYATAATAAAESGYSLKWSRKQGYRLLRTDRIRARIREIQSNLVAGHGRDIDVLLGKLEIVYCRAIEDHHFYAAARAVELQAKLGGMAKLPALIPRDTPAPPLMIPGDTPAPPLIIPGDTPAPPGIQGKTESASPGPPDYQPPGEQRVNLKMANLKPGGM